MPISNTKIANLALIKVGAKIIESLSEESPRANIMDILFEPTRDELLEGYEWNFAMKRAALVAKTITTEEDLEFDHAFHLPNDPYCLRVTEMINSEEEFKVEGRTLLTRISEVNIKYIARIEDPLEFTPSFITALWMLLASRAAGSSIKKDAQLEANLFAIHEVLLTRAKANDGQEGTAEDFISSELTDVRFQTNA